MDNILSLPALGVMLYSYISLLDCEIPMYRFPIPSFV